MNTMRHNRSYPIMLAALAALSVAGLGALMTDLSEWYFALQKPSWQPPDWAFGPAWTLIYALTAIAGVFAWTKSDSKVSRQNLLIVFLINGTLNVTWSLLFFRLQRPDWALYEVFFFWLSIIALLITCGRRDKRAAWLLLPYLAWVSFAAAINFSVVQLNAPFANG